MANIVLTNPAWTFFNTPASLQVSPTTFNGIASNCALCSVSRMFTIAEPNGADGSCYGMCTGTGDGLWNEVVMGELINACGPTSFGLSNPCTIQWASTNWWNGQFMCQACNYYDNPPNGTDLQAAEGLTDLSWNGTAARVRTTAANSKLQASGLPTAPTSACTPDSMGYCDVFMSGGVTDSCQISIVNGKPIMATNKTATYYIFKQAKMQELQEIATQTTTACSGTRYIGTTVSWSPGNPATQYGDSSLP